MADFTGNVTISAQGLYDLLAEHIDEERAAAMVVALTKMRPAEAAPAIEAPASDGQGSGVPDTYTNIDNGSVARVVKTDESYAYFTGLGPAPRHWAMAIAEYRSPAFRESWRSATAEECVAASSAFASPI